MLGDWYFSCCIGNNPRQTRALLAILDTLDNPHSNATQIALAYAELPRMQVAERVYAFPRLLWSLRRADRPEGWSYQLSPYVSGLTDQISSPEQQQELDRLLQCAIQKTSAADIMAALTRCLRLVVPPAAHEAHAAEPTSKPERPSPTSTPYLDVTQFIVEALWLAVAVHTSAGDDEVVAVLRATIGDVDSPRPERVFLNDALDGRLGRLAQCLATELALLLRDNPDVTITRLWHAEHCAVPFEPDLLQAVARLFFARETVATIIEEVATLPRFAAAIRQYGMPNHASTNAVLRRLNLPAPKELLDALPVVFWQWALYDMASRIDPCALSSEVSRHWQQYNSQRPARIEFSSPISSTSAALAQRALNSLRGLRPDLLRGIAVSVRSRTPFATPTEIHWLLSPWVEEDVLPSGKNPYERAQFAPTLIRLVALSSIAARILSSATEGTERNALAALVVHASDVLDARYEKWLKNHDKPEAHDQKGRKLPLSLTGLALFGYRQVQMAGQGELSDVSPEIFLSLLPQNPAGPFQSVILPRALLSWLADAYKRAIKGTGPHRWLPHIPEVYQTYRRSWEQAGDKVNQRNATLLLRFLCPKNPTVGAALPDPDWRTMGRGWQIYGQDLLLTRPLPPSQWMPNWAEPDWDAPDGPYRPGVPNRNARKGMRLVRAIERVASLSLADEFGETVSNRQRDDWWQDLRNCLSEISNSQNLDRFTRLRLIELLDTSSLKDRPDDQLQIAMLLLEYGVGYEIEQLLDAVFKGDVTAASQRVRSGLLAAMREHQSMHTTSEEQEARDPRAVRDELMKRDVIDNSLLRLGFEAARSLQEAEPAAVPAWAREYVKVLQRQKTFHARTVDATIVKTYGHAKAEIQSEVHADISDDLVCAAVLAPDGSSATFFVDDVALNGLENLFACSEEKFQTKLNSPPGTNLRVLARVVDVSDATDIPPHARFHCGMPWHLRCRLRPDDDVRVGDWVALPITNRDNGSWHIPFDEEIHKVVPRTRAGDVARFNIHEWSTDEPGVWRLVPAPHWEGRFNIREWDADLSRRFRKPRTLEKWEVEAECHGNGTWAPVCSGLLDLVLKACRFEAGTVAVLTFIDRDRRPPYGERAYQFSTEPGKNYRLFRHDFHDAAADRLDAEVLRAGDASGLLVAVTPELRDGRLALNLFAGPVSDQSLLALYQQLKPPFDWRNLHWRRVFEETDLLMAEAGQGGWVFRIDQEHMPGFPDIRLIWADGHWPAGGIGQTEFVPAQPEDGTSDEEWSTEAQWRSCVARAWSGSNSLNIRNHHQWADFLMTWLGLKAGDQITITYAGKIAVHNGSLVGFTAEGMPVQVDADSVTMRRVRRDGRIGRLNPPRRAVIREVPRIATSIALTAPIPPELDGLDTIEGIVYSVGKQTCSVLWRAGNDGFLQEGMEIHESRLPDQPPNWKNLVGKFIRRRRTASGYRYEVVWRMPTCQALWEVVEEDRAKRDQLVYLGLVAFDGGQFEAAEGRMGELVLLRSKPPRAQHLAIGTTLGLSIDDPTDNEASPHNPWIEHTRRYQRAVLRFGEDLVVGRSYDSAPRHHVGVYNVRMELTELATGQPDAPRLFRLSRTFELQQLAVRRVEPRQPRPQPEQNWLALIEAYIQEPKDIQTLYNPKERIVTLDNLRIFAGGKWTRVVPLHDDGQTFLADPAYTDAGRATVRLFQSPPGQWSASFRLVPPMDANSLREELGQHNWAAGTPLPWSLHYCGREEIDPVTKQPYGEIRHRFEWGYGKTLLVPEDRLKFRGAPFATTRLLVCYGDRVTELEFNDVGGPPSICEINITGIEFDYDVHSLYEQRNQMKMVHALHLQFTRNNVVVKVVEGLNENVLTNNRPNEVRRPQMMLHEEDVARLLQRIGGSANQHSAPTEMTVLGRLDAGEFERTRGKRIVFHHVRLTMRSEDEAALDPGEILFMQGGEIRRIANDVLLQILPPDLNEEDIGEDFRSLVVLRRNFSLREDLLGRILDDEGPEGLQGPILVRIGNDNERTRAPNEKRPAPDGAVEETDGAPLHPADRNEAATARHSTRQRRIALSIKAVPARRTKVLQAALGGQQGLLAAVAPVRNDKEDDQVLDAPEVAWRLELSPGIFVELPSTEIEETREHIEVGDIVQVERRGEKYCLLPAAFGHTRYISDLQRAAVALPTNNLIRADHGVSQKIRWHDFWQRRMLFTVGDLPGLYLTPGRYDDNNWLPPDPHAFVQLMRDEHPKLVWLHVDDKGAPRIEPIGDARCAGNLQADDDLQIWYRPLRPDRRDPEREMVSWRSISFADEPARHILKRCDTERWWYHDDSTTTWPASGPEGNLQRLPDYHNVFSGPLFFDVYQDRPPQLRYRQHELLRYGLPVDSLIQSLRQHEGTWTYPVVGCSENMGFWVELVPGRIVEVPSRRVFCRLGSHDLLPAKMYWPAFAPGDVVTLSLATTELELRTPDKIILDDWRPGPRAAFGSARCFLPVRSFDSESGALCVGLGEYALTLPEIQALAPGSTIILHRDNTIEPVQSQLPKHGDVVLLTADEKGKLAVAGLPQITPQLIPVDPREEREEFADPRSLAAFISAIGDAIPVTVNRLEHGVLSFSQRTGNSIDRLPTDLLSIARVVGYASESKTAIIRFGASLCRIAMDRVVEGLPRACYPEAAARLKETGVGIWIRGRPGGRIDIGLKKESSNEFTVDALVDVCTDYEGTQLSGLICRSINSGTLHWLPEEFIAWTTLAPAELGCIIRHPGASGESGRRTMRVRRTEAFGPVGIVRVPTVAKEFGQLTVGTRLTVRDLHVERTDGRRTCLVESFASKVIFECVRHGDAPFRCEEFSVEITHRSKQNGRYLLQAVLPDERRHHLQLPAWMLNPLTPGELCRPQFLSYLEAVERGSMLPSPAGPIRQLSEGDLDDRLCHAYGAWRCGRGTSADEFAIAQEWIGRYRDAPDMPAVDAVPALCAAVLFARCAQPDLRDSKVRRELTFYLRSLGRRALGSIHAECISRLWLCSNDPPRRQENAGYWKRLNSEIIDRITGGDLTAAQLADVQRFCETVRIAGEARIADKPLVTVAEALLAATGRVVTPTSLYPPGPCTRVCEELILVSSSLKPSVQTPSADVLDWCMVRIELLLDYAIPQSLDVALLQSVPEIRSTV